MDRRQLKTRNAIFRAFTTLLENRSYTAITVQDIIDEANIGRSTFYAHFETRDALLEALCRELFDHIMGVAMNQPDTHGLYTCTNAPTSAICHILQHLQENDNGILTLLTCQSNQIFLRYFKLCMDELVRVRLLNGQVRSDLPREFLINHISGSFVELVQWWVEGGCTQSPQQLDACFRAVTEPIIGGNQNAV